ncbi:MAG: magnesium transporter CorA family protein [Candidatus Gastranaerophilales bacterium]|nr:magnesium transporter CorA family protein [Candidatus Gastranaerophilales bacterium]
MIEILKTTDKNKLVELGINEAQNGSWFNLINPDYDEIQKVSIVLNLDESFLRNSLDADERSRIEIEDDCVLIITNVPLMEDEGTYDTLPLGIIFTQRGFITVSSKKNRVIGSFNKETSNSFDTNNKTKFMLDILFRSTKYYLRYLNYIYKKSEEIEEELRKTMKNKALFQLFEIQKSLVYFTTALRDNYMVLQKIMRLTKTKQNSLFKFSEDDIDLLEDVIIENKQALEMVEMHRNILENMMDAFASIISNNLNIVMKFLTSIAIIFAIPTMFSSFWGMNVAVPFGNNEYGFLIVSFISLLAAIAAIIFFARKGMF